MFAEKIDVLENNIDLIQKHRDALINDWLNHDNLIKTFQKFDIDLNTFKTTYAYHILDNYISVIKKELAIGEMPALTHFLRFFDDQEVELADLYSIITHLRETIIELFFGLNIMSSELYKAVCYIFNENFKELIRDYSNTIFQIEQELLSYKKNFEQYNVVLNQSALVSRTDPDGLIRYVNSNFIELSGYSDEELIWSSYDITRHPDVPEAFYKDLWRTITNGENYRNTIKNRKKDGSDYYVDTTILPLFDANNSTKEFLFVAYDVTELILAKDRAIEAAKAKDIFISNMSHEIRTPLNAIMGFVDILRKKTTDVEDCKFLDTVSSSSHALLDVTTDILDFEKIQNQKFNIHIEKDDLIKRLSPVVHKFSKEATKKGIIFNCSIDSKVPKNVETDFTRVNQIFANLLSNAIKFTPTSGTVDVSIRADEGYLIITIKDSGEGISPDKQTKIFNTFEQADNATTKKHSGIGLGLAIGLKLANYMGGKIHVESILDKGSTFTMTLPITYDHHALFDMSIDYKTEMDTTEAKDEAKAHYQGHILVAEDNKSNQMLITVLLKEFGLNIDMASDGKEAYEMYEKNQLSGKTPYDLILMDHQMPLLNGIDSTAKIREIEKEHSLQQIPIVALTANALKGDREYFLQNGLDDYIKKPIEVKELERVLIENLKSV